MVLWPEVIDAVAPTPVLAAGGIGTGRQIAAALAHGRAGRLDRLDLAHGRGGRRAAGADRAYLNATSRDTVRSRSWTGQAVPHAANDWTEAWETPETPEAARHAAAVHGHVGGGRARHRYADEAAQEVAFNPVGQIVGQMNEVRAGARRDLHARRGVPRGERPDGDARREVARGPTTSVARTARELPARRR